MIKFNANRYLIEIAKIYNIEYEPDPQVMIEDHRPTGMENYFSFQSYFNRDIIC